MGFSLLSSLPVDAFPYHALPWSVVGRNAAVDVDSWNHPRPPHGGARAQKRRWVLPLSVFVTRHRCHVYCCIGTGVDVYCLHVPGRRRPPPFVAVPYSTTLYCCCTVLGDIYFPPYGVHPLWSNMFSRFADVSVDVAGVTNALIMVITLQASGNLVNSYIDHNYGVDTVETAGDRCSSHTISCDCCGAMLQPN